MCVINFGSIKKFSILLFRSVSGNASFSFMKTKQNLYKSKPALPFASRVIPGLPGGSILKLVLLLTCIAGGSMPAATFYVRPDGNNNNSGLANNAGGAWRTIQKAASAMVAGDGVVVADGTYGEAVVTGSNGAPGRRIKFQAQSTNTLVASFMVNKAYNTIEGFTITGESPLIYASVNIATGGDYLNITSNVFQGSRVGLCQVYANYYSVNVKSLLATGNKFLNGWGHAVALASGGGHVISNNYFSSPNGYDALRIVATNITIVDNTFTNWSSKSLSSGPLKVGAAYFFTTVGNAAEMDWSNVGCRKFYRQGTNYCFVATGTTPTRWGNAVVASSDNKLLYPGKNHALLIVGEKYYFQFIYLPQWDDFSNVQGMPTRLTGIENCWTATGTNPLAWGYAILGCGSNIVLTNGQSLVVGQSYYFLSNAGNPDFDNVGAETQSAYLAGEAYPFVATNTMPIGWGTGTVVANANHPDIIQSFQNGAVGTIPPDRPCWDLLFERNLVIDCPVQLGNISDDGNFGNINRWTFRNNVFVRVSNALNLYAPGFSFHNNTFYHCGFVSGNVVSWGVAQFGTACNLEFFNNIVAECGFAERANAGWYGGMVASNQIADYNLVVGTGTGIVKSGFNEPHSINGSDPLFVNPAANDFRLLPNSPCIGAGTNLSFRFNVDYKEAVRGATWDMGAYEYQTLSIRGGAIPSVPRRLSISTNSIPQ